MQKILIIDNSKYFTGAFKSLMLSVSALKDKYDFYFCIDENSNVSKYLAEKDLPFITVSFHELSKDLKSVRYKQHLKQNADIVWNYMSSNDISIIHVNDFYNQIGVRIKKKHPKIKLVYHVRLMKHSYLRLVYPYFMKKVAKHADAIISVSESVKNEVKAYTKNTITIYDPLIHDRVVQRKKKSDNSPVKLLALGSLIKGKGQDLILKGFHKALKEDDKLQLTFVGGNPNDSKYGSKLLDYIEQKGLNDKVVFKPFSTTNQALFDKYDISIMFSESESFSYVSLESLYFGIPLIASDCGGPRELFEHRKSGLLVDNRDTDQLAKAILKLAGDSELRQAFSENGKEFVREKFSLDKSAKHLEKVYKSLSK